MEDSVNVLKFAECRAKEIMTLMEDVKAKGAKQSSQRLPYHMRRRAASHNPKRIPRSLRVKVIKPEESQSKHKKKTKVHKDLLEEYNSRQKPDSLWLPTHIWFAKRFHMKKMWGYQLSFQATGKRFRSSYRAVVKNVLAQDLSYFCCIELKGNQEKLLSLLSHLTDDSTGLSFASESYIDGTREGSCFLYHPDSFPFNAIGPVTFLWKPLVELDQENSNSSPSNPCRQLWIWCHPSIHDELVQTLISVFEFKQTSKTSINDYQFASKTNFMKTKLHFQKEPLYVSDNVTMTLLKDTLVRHRLIGPSALAILTSVLKPVESSEELCLKTLENSKGSSNQTVDSLSQTIEMPSVGNKEELLSLVSQKQHLWGCMRNPNSAYFTPLRSIIGLTVDDPRIYVTAKDGDDCEEGNSIEEVLDEFSKPFTAYSALWWEDIRNETTASQIPEHIINEEKGKYVVPKASNLKQCTTSVPVIVIHQPGANGFGSGWDIIAPQGWGMAFWIPFIYHGAQPSGLDDFCSVHLESGLPTFPFSFPDTKAGCDYEENNRANNLKKHYKYSRAKRPNFKILGVPSPFFMPWKILVKDWEVEFLNKYSKCISSVTDSSSPAPEKCFFTLRNTTEIRDLQMLCKLLNAVNKAKEDAEYFQDILSTKIQSILTTQTVYLKAVILVRVECLSRGTPSNCSGIYMPDECDLELLKNDRRYFGPVEGKHSLETDSLPAKKRRKILKEEAKQERKNLDRPEIETVFSSSERKVIGYISEGGYCRLGGQGYGTGLCTLTSFLTLIDLCRKNELAPTVLVREQHSFQYRPATVKIITDIF